MQSELNDHPCERSYSVHSFRERGCGSACQGDSARYALLSLMYAARVYANLHRHEVGYQSSLKEGIRANNAEQQWVFRGSELRTISTLLAFVGFPRIHGAMFSNVAVVHKFFCSRLCYVTIHKPIGNYVCIFSLFFSLRAFYPFTRALSLVIFLFPLSRYKICSNANGERNRKDKIFALETGEFNLLLRSRWGRRRKNNRLWCTFVCIISATRINSLKSIILRSLRIFFAFIIGRIKTLGEGEKKGENKIVRGSVWSNCQVPIHKSDKVRKCAFYKSTRSKRACDTFS